jgi:hypothetical protein
MFIVAVIRITVAVIGVLLLASAVLGIDVAAVPFAGMTLTGGLISWLTIRKNSRSEEEADGSEQGEGGG